MLQNVVIICLATAHKKCDSDARADASLRAIINLLRWIEVLRLSVQDYDDSQRLLSSKGFGLHSIITRQAQ
jgi:hypothetical protein